MTYVEITPPCESVPHTRLSLVDDTLLLLHVVLQNDDTLRTTQILPYPTASERGGSPPKKESCGVERERKDTKAES